MTVVIYAIAECSPSEVRDVKLDGPRLDAVAEGQLTAVFADQALTDQASTDRAPTEDELWGYERVIEALMDRHPIVPMRYGSQAEDRGQVAAMLRERREEFTAAVERVKGTVELSVRAAYDDPPTADRARSGREYMLGQVERHRRTAALRQRLEGLAGSARASRIRELNPPGRGLHAAYLVAPEHVSAFAEQVSELSRSLPEIDFVCTGPWPPYTFAEEASR